MCLLEEEQGGCFKILSFSTVSLNEMQSWKEHT